jgi:hypothetical protein
MSTMLYEYFEEARLIVLVHGESAPSDDEWEPYIALLNETYYTGRLRRVFVFGDGPGPNARQREKLHYKASHGPLRISVVTHSLLARGIVTALSWFYEIRAYAPGEVEGAFDYLTLQPADRRKVREVVAQFRVRLSMSSEFPSIGAIELSDTIKNLDELVADRLPKLRERVRRARAGGE